MLHILDFPNELLNLIFEQDVVDVRDLLSASHACRRFRDVIEALLSAKYKQDDTHFVRILNRDTFESALQMRLMAEQLYDFSLWPVSSNSWSELKLSLSIHEPSSNRPEQGKRSWLMGGLITKIYESTKHWPFAVQPQRIKRHAIMFQEKDNTTIFETRVLNITITVGGVRQTHEWRRNQLLRDVILPLDMCSMRTNHKFVICWYPDSLMPQCYMDLADFKELVRSTHCLQQLQDWFVNQPLIAELFARDVLYLDA